MDEPDWSGDVKEVPSDETAQLAGQALGAALRKRRTELGLKQQEVAERAGLEYKHYQALEAGLSHYGTKAPANPNFRHIMGLAEALSTNVPDLMFDVFGGIQYES
ncbi:MAG TPA: helix-turn-helix transcriptional regulator [Aeromicrobium sp.]|nr:helix-turn-helix transcriptional regulator [Aeromicrobium sp.]